MSKQGIIILDQVKNEKKRLLYKIAAVAYFGYGVQHLLVFPIKLDGNEFRLLMNTNNSKRFSKWR